MTRGTRGRAPERRPCARQAGVAAILAVLGLAAALAGWRMLAAELESGERYRKLAETVAHEEEDPPPAGAGVPAPAGGDGQAPASRAGDAPRDARSGLAADNADYRGWLSVVGTGIDLPVACDPPDRPGYYLDHDIWTDYDINGCPYLDSRCAPDGRHALVYGHRMNDLSVMFGPLQHRFHQDLFDELEAAQWTTPGGGTCALRPLCSMRVPPGYATVQRFDFEGDPDFRAWLAALLDDADARASEARTLAQGARRALTCVTCVFDGGEEMRTLVVFVA